MSRYHAGRSVKVCKICGEGYDGFKALDARGRYCSPACLQEARRRHREHVVQPDDEPAVGPATLPLTVNLGNRGSVVRLDLLGDQGDDRRLV